jgi:hypothetical protein
MVRQSLLLLVLGSLAWAEDGRSPVVVELFTSEGCSSCPPADRLLIELERKQPVGDAVVIPLEEHVDYWNNLGWPDRFSSPQFRVRQNDYARFFRTDSVFTPQMIVNGRAQFVGGDAVSAYQEIARAGAVPAAYALRLQRDKTEDADVVNLSVRLRRMNRSGERPRLADVLLAVTEGHLSSDVRGGENSGHLLRHAPVVRSFGTIAQIDDAHSVSNGDIRSTLKFPQEWNHENLKAVVFVQERNSRSIIGASVIDLR